jgi:tetratricopeptide (TPR) repeat protein
LGYTLVDRTRHHRDGYEMIEQALQQTPNSGAVLDSMGWALHRLDRNQEALEYLERSRARINDPEVEIHISEVLLKLNRKEDARSTLHKALERYPDHEKLKRRAQALEPSANAKSNAKSTSKPN